MTHLMLAFLAGLGVAMGFAPIGVWPLTILGFAALLLLVESAPSMRSALARGWWFGVGQFVLGLNWIATAFTFQAKMPAWLGWIAVVLLAFYLAVYPAMASGLAWRWARGRRLALTLMLAAAWIVTEWLRATMFTGFAWNPVGVALVGTSAAGAARLIGTYGLSGLVVLFGGVVLMLTGPGRRQAAGLFAGAAALVLVAVLSDRAPIGDGGMPVRIVQPNIGQQDKWRDGFEEENIRRLIRYSDRSANAPPRLLLWPEAAVTEPLGDDRDPYLRRVETLRSDLGRLLGPDDLLLTGGITIRSADGIFATSATNSVFAIDPGGGVRARYDKAHLVPYGEYLPMRPLLSAIGLSRLAPGDLDYDSGPGARTLNLGAFGSIGLQICYEIIFSGHVVDKAARPEFIFNPSNDAWFGAFGPPQHLAQARLRAIEEGLPVIRATPTGISAIIDADGHLLASLPWREGGAIDGNVPGAKPPTPFARLGNALALLFALALAGIAFALARKPG